MISFLCMLSFFVIKYAKTHMERFLFYQILFGVGMVLAIWEFVAFGIISAKSNIVNAEMTGQCVDGLSGEMGHYSKWHDLDSIYLMNDYVLESGICSDLTDYRKSYVQNLTICQQKIFENNDIRADHLEFIKGIETKYGSTTEELEIQQASMGDNFKENIQNLRDNMKFFKSQQCQGFC